MWIGAPSGIGQEFAPQAAVNGINVVLLARREERMTEVAAEPTARYDVQARAVAPPSAVTGSSTGSPRDRRPGIVLVSAMAAAGGLPCTANNSATKAHPLNLGEALHAEQRPAGVHMTVLVPVLVNTPVAADPGSRTPSTRAAAQSLVPEAAPDSVSH
jgi:short-subunit dehydrogenase